jgi:hypothetical protein
MALGFAQQRRSWQRNTRAEVLMETGDVVDAVKVNLIVTASVIARTNLRRSRTTPGKDARWNTDHGGEPAALNRRAVAGMNGLWESS